MRSLLSLLPLLAVYLMGVFINWEANPGNWGEASRILAVIVAVCVTAVVSAIVWFDQ